MRQLHFVLTALVFLFTLNGQAGIQKRPPAKAKNQMTLTLAKSKVQKTMVRTNTDAPRVTGTIASKAIRTAPSNAPMAVAFHSKPPTAHVGSVSCAAKNHAFSPFSKEGKLTGANQVAAKIATQQSATGSL